MPVKLEISVDEIWFCVRRLPSGVALSAKGVDISGVRRAALSAREIDISGDYRTDGQTEGRTESVRSVDRFVTCFPGFFSAVLPMMAHLEDLPD